MTMVKKLSRMSGGLKEASLLRKFSHPNIIEMIEVFVRDDDVYIELEYCRFTLEDVVNVHIRFEEPHLRLIAHSVLLSFTFSYKTEFNLCRSSQPSAISVHTGLPTET